MKKLMTALVAVMALAFMVNAGTYEGAVQTLVDSTVFTNYATIASATDYNLLEQYVFVNNSASTATVVVASVDRCGSIISKLEANKSSITTNVHHATAARSLRAAWFPPPRQTCRTAPRVWTRPCATRSTS